MTQREQELANEKRELFKQFTRVDKKFMAARSILLKIANCATLKEAQTMAWSALNQLPIDHSVERQIPSLPMEEIIRPAPKADAPPPQKKKRGPKKDSKASLGGFF